MIAAQKDQPATNMRPMQVATGTANATHPAGQHASAVLPKDAKIISLLLKNHGIDECEPKVIQMLIEFGYRHSIEIMQEGLIYAEHANRTDLSIDDVRLATQRVVNTSFITPASREVVSKIAADKNSIPLPIVENEDPIKLPPEEYCLLAPHYKVTSLKMPSSNVSSQQTRK